MIDLDALERLATEASRTPWVTIEASFVGPDGTAAALYRDVRAAGAQIALHTACDPVVVAALVRAVRAALWFAGSTGDRREGEAEFYAALAPFAAGPGEETGE